MFTQFYGPRTSHLVQNEFGLNKIFPYQNYSIYSDRLEKGFFYMKTIMKNMFYFLKSGKTQDY